jgi:mono/diheme cytochrome c family protein
MSCASKALATIAILIGLAACDNRQAFHEPDPTFARMLRQRRANPYSASAAFRDGKTMQEPPRGTVPRAMDGRDMDAHGKDNPPPVSRELVETGRVHFERICATCHGIVGDGQSVVATKMARRPPPTLHRPHTREHLFVVATEGYGLMPSYADALTPDQRWAVIFYLQALQLSQRARVADLPPDLRAELAKEAP